MKIKVGEGPEFRGLDIGVSSANIEMDALERPWPLTLTLRSGEHLDVTPRPRGGFMVRYHGETSDRERLMNFDQGLTVFKDGFPAPPEKVDDADSTSPGN